jgi:hypothetical protein
MIPIEVEVLGGETYSLVAAVVPRVGEYVRIPNPNPVSRRKPRKLVVTAVVHDVVRNLTLDLPVVHVEVMER